MYDAVILGRGPAGLSAAIYLQRGSRRTAVLGRDGGALADQVDQALVVPATRTARVQEMHILILHLLCEAIDAADGR